MVLVGQLAMVAFIDDNLGNAKHFAIAGIALSDFIEDSAVRFVRAALDRIGMHCRRVQWLAYCWQRSDTIARK